MIHELHTESWFECVDATTEDTLQPYKAPARVGLEAISVELTGVPGDAGRRDTPVTSSVRSSWLPSTKIETLSRVERGAEHAGSNYGSPTLWNTDDSPQRRIIARYTHCTKSSARRWAFRLRHPLKHHTSPSWCTAHRIVLHRCGRVSG